ncbi:MAG: hypothetical protein OEV30_06955 [Ignavibacteria bacterium]|nr:hypothetical protein [Ignavibacteria bacterium]
MIRSFVLPCLLLPLIAFPANGGADPYQLLVTGGAGYNAYIAETPPYTSNSGGFSGTVRFMWKPEHRLSVGLETGYLYMYSVEATNVGTDFGSTDLFGARSAIPISIVFTMDVIDRLQVTAGAGEFVVMGTTESFGNETRSSSLSTGFLGAVSYLVPVSPTLEVGGEAKWYTAAKFEDAGVSFQLMMRWKALEW